MSETLYEIVMLSNGDVVLQRADKQETPLVTISFSDESKAMLSEHRIDVAKAMIDAGIDTLDELSQSTLQMFSDDGSSDRTIH